MSNEPENGRHSDLLRPSLERGKATGVILHKIDRGARNLWDWARIQDLIDIGVEVHFAHDNVDLTSRGGRLSADIQAVVAADYIRNLRDEVMKGVVGRLKQGLWPWPAPLGYVNCGRGRAKTIDAVKGPLVAIAFEKYASALYTLDTLRDDMLKLGLRSREGRTLSKNQLNLILRNPFYIGLLVHRTTGLTYQGVHAPLISKALFDRVQEVLDARIAARIISHSFIYRRLIHCGRCAKALTGETQKGHDYYRCHTKHCDTKSVRVEAIGTAIDLATKQVRQSLSLVGWKEPSLLETRALYQRAIAARRQAIQMQLEQLELQLNRLMDGYLDGVVPADLFGERNQALVQKRVGLREQIQSEDDQLRRVEQAMHKCRQLMELLPLSDPRLSDDERRSALSVLVSDIAVYGTNVVVALREPFSLMVTTLPTSECSRKMAPRGPTSNRSRAEEIPCLTTQVLRAGAESADSVLFCWHHSDGLRTGVAAEQPCTCEDMLQKILPALADALQSWEPPAWLSEREHPPL